MAEPADLIVTGVGELVTVDPELGDGPLGVLRGGAVAALDGRVAWVGRTSELRRAVWLMRGGTELDVRGRVVAPGFVDSHTSLVFAGSREREFSRRIAGATCREIASEGGGTQATIQATRDATADELVALARRRLDLALRHGTTTLEAKSGYGLTTADELKMLEAIRSLAAIHPVDVRPTFLGARAVPSEFAGRTDAYVELIVGEMLPEVARQRLAEYCDVVCEPGIFDAAQARRILTAGRERGLRPKLQADGLRNGGGAELAAELGAVSADHLAGATIEGIRAMQAAGVTATLLPGAALALGLPYPPAREFLETGVRVALATGFDPGASYTLNMQLVIALACTQMRMTVEEAIRAATLGGACALGLEHERGSLQVGKRCDLVVLDLPNYLHLPYLFGVNHVRTVVVGGCVGWSVDWTP